MAIKEYFPEIGKIKFEGKKSKNPLAYRYYDAEKVVMGKKMKDGIHCVPKEVISLVEVQRNSLGTILPML